MSTAATAQKRRLCGSTLIEVMLAVLILVIALIGTSSTYVLGRRFVVSQRYCQAAAQLAAQKLEQLKAAGYDDPNGALDVGEYEEERTVGTQSYHRHTQIETTAAPTAEVPKPCKKVTVTILWSYVTDQHKVSLVTYIGP
jgi:Tfp pilus assembly protein PilV